MHPLESARGAGELRPVRANHSDEGARFATATATLRAMAAIEPQLASEPVISRLYGRYYERVLSFCLWRLRNREDAEDAAQTTFLDAHRALGRGTVPASEAAWLLGIAQNVCRLRWRSERRHPPITACEPETLAEIAAPHTDPELWTQLQEALHRLPEQQRRALLLREFGDLSYVDIAERLETTEAAVAALVFRAREAVAAAFGDERPRRRRRAPENVASLLAWFRSLGFGSASKVAASGLAAIAVSVAGVATVPHARKPFRAERAPSAAAIGGPNSEPRRQRSTLRTAVRAAHPAAARPATARAQHAPPPVKSKSPALPPQSAVATQPAPTPTEPTAAAPALTTPTSPPPAASLSPTSTPAATTPAVSTPPLTTPAVSTPVASVASVTVPPVTIPPVTVPAIPLR
jgi:RNA polymerase sigma factor (sigma-70 family)